jgi:hypothetical protein
MRRVLAGAILSVLLATPALAANTTIRTTRPAGWTFGR